MRKILLAAAFIINVSALLAQKIQVSESNEHIAGGNNNALSVTIYQASQEDVEKEVKSLLKKYDAKVTSQDGGWFGDNAVIKKMSNNTVDLYAKLEKVKEGETKVILAFDLGGAFLSSSNTKQFGIAKEILVSFASKITAEALADMVKMEEKKFDKVSDEEKKLEKENERMKDEIKSCKEKIEDCNKRIKEAEINIEANRKMQENKKLEVSLQQKALGEAKEKQKKMQ